MIKNERVITNLKDGLSQKISRAVLSVIMVLFLGQMLQAYSFKAPLTDVQHWLSGNSVYFQVWDPAANALKSGSHHSTSTTFVSVRDGVVAIISSGNAFFYVYDPSRGSWQSGSFQTSFTSQDVTNMTNNNGIVTFLAWGDAYFYVYDASRGNWQQGHCQTGSTSVEITNLTNNNGVVAMSAWGNAHFYVYDPSPSYGSWRHGFVQSNISSLSVYNLINSDGVVACIFNSKVYYCIYNTDTNQWEKDSQYSTSPSNLSISKATVSWYSNGTYYNRGYDHESRNWNSTPTHPYSKFIKSPVWESNGRDWIWFNDMSIVGTSISWNLGNGMTATGDTVLHSYYTPGTYTVEQTVVDFGRYHKSTQIIEIDTAPPAGTISINNDASSTHSTPVTLTLQANDNSGSVAEMRFSNNNSSWSSWESYNTWKTWDLEPGTGSRSVYVQYRDSAGNTSNSSSDSITLLAPIGITLNSPNGNETLYLGESHTITWNASY
ncbi:MAG: hypothetical protein GY757_26905, partial [bacterium]|nr:hypothetical protein [bacterium]